MSTTHYTNQYRPLLEYYYIYIYICLFVQFTVHSQYIMRCFMCSRGL